MRGAFVVVLCKTRPGVAGRMEGSVEEVDTGRQLQFGSGKELVEFLRTCFAESQKTSGRKKTDEGRSPDS